MGADGLCCRLTQACPRPTPLTNTINRDVWEIERDELSLHKKLAEGNFGEVWKGKLVGKLSSYPTVSVSVCHNWWRFLYSDTKWLLIWGKECFIKNLLKCRHVECYDRSGY